MTSAIPSQKPQLNAASNSTAAAPAAAAAASSTSETTTPSAAAPAQQPIRSYASAATKNHQESAQHGKVSPVNGAKNSNSSNSSQAANNSASQSTNNMQNGEHGRKPSVLISASGTTGQIPNGAPVGQNSRPNINFGSINAPSGSPAIATSVPHQAQTPSLNAPKDPRVTSPTHSPSPIPQPAASGGKPPSTLPNQSNGLSFGSMGAENGDMSVSRDMLVSTFTLHNAMDNHELTPSSQRTPQAPLTPGQQPAHLRRESSQSTHSDMGMRGGFVSQGGRGRGNGYNNMPYPQSPGQGYRQMNNSRGPPNMPPQYQNPQAMGFSPGGRGRGASPMLMQAQPFVPGQPQMHGNYPQHHLNPQQQVSADYTLHTPHSFVAVMPKAASMPNSQVLNNNVSTQENLTSLPEYSVNSAQRDEKALLQHPTSDLYPQAYYGGQPPFDPNYGGYYGNFYPQQQQFPHGGAPPSPRPHYPVPYGAPSQQQHMPPTFHSNMSRSASQISERPSSSVGPSAAPNAAPSAPGTPAQSNSSFQIPAKKASKAIVIKNDKGEEVTFEKKPSPAPSAVAQSPAIVSSVPTPPPRTPSVQHNRAESTTKSAAETKNQFQEQVKAQLEARKAKEEEEKRASQAKEDAQSKVVKDKEDAEAKAAQDEEAAAKKEAEEKEAAEKKAVADKEAADKAAAEKEAADKAAADKAASDKAAAEKAAADKEAADKAAAEKEAADKEAAEKAASDKAASDKAAADKEAAEKEASEKKASEDAESAAKSQPADHEETEDERLEREIAEMEAAEKAEEERERAYTEKRNKEKEELKKKEAEAAKKADEEMKRLEREAEELEIAREKERENKQDTEETDKDSSAELFASLKKPTLGPGAEAESDAAPTEPERAAKSKPAALKLETNKPVEAAQPTPGMKSLQSARFLDLKSTQYPDGFKSPNPALNQTGKRVGKEYDMDFLLQFQNIFKEKPSTDWDQRIKETLGEGGPTSAHGGQGRTPSSMGARQGSRGTGGSNSYTAMGSFANSSRTLPAGTSSADRFAASQAQQRGGPVGFPGRPGGTFPMGGPQGMSRTNSVQTMGPGSPKVGGSSRRGGGGGGGGSRRGPSNRHDDRKDADAAKTMPLTAGMDLKPLEKSTTGWTPRSLTVPASQQQADTSGQMAPDMVQRKVKAALNKMTPENFERISDQIMAISDQSKNEKDGRTLRQVIQLTFEKACDEAHWAGTYAKFCSKMLHSMNAEIVDETIRDRNNNPVVGGGLFRKYLLNRCQEEFERGWEANLPDKPEGESQEAVLLSDEYYIAAAAKRRGLGLIQFIGELYKLGMLTVKIMHQCVLRLLNFEGQPDEAAVENLSKLLKAVGSTMDSSEQGHQLVDMYYQRLQSILDTHKDMPSRSRFMLMVSLINFL